MRKYFAPISMLFTATLASLSALAQEAVPAAAEAVAAAPTVDTGDTAWVLVSTALVFFMTPGLAFFYAGMTRTKNVVSTLLQNYAAIAVVGLVWAICGYSLAFSGDVGGFIGNLNWAFLSGVGQAPNADYSATIPHGLFMLFQGMFAVITPALISGAVAERVGFKGWLAFMAVWSLIVYSPVAHWVWGVGGWIRNMGGLDFAGGMVVHMTAGFSALVAAKLLGARRNVPADAKPYDIGHILLGAGILIFGWFGFNGGSALGANGLAVQAFGTTFFACAAATLSWMVYDLVTKGKMTASGAACGAVVGLVTITPGAGFVSFMAAIIMGLASGVICNFAVTLCKKKGWFDDALDVFACHGVGGTLGTILTAVFASKAINPAGNDGLLNGNPGLLVTHLICSAAVIAVSVIGTFIAIKLVGVVFKYRVSETEEVQGLDGSQHGEAINSNFDGGSHGGAAHKRAI